MPTPSFFDEPRLVRLSKLLQEIKDGEIHVPRFQRPFVWTDNQRLELLQSVYLGYPIGSILVWRTQTRRLKTYERLGPVRLPPQESGLQLVQQYLLDGHQRMTTLFASLGPGLYEDDELEGAWASDLDDIRWPVFFDLSDDGPQPFRLLRRRTEMPHYTWLPLDILLDSFALGEFKDVLRKKGEPRSRVNRVQAVADTLRDYTIPVVPTATEDLEQVTNSFKRVNSGGTKMNEVHMVNALTWSENFDLLERLDELAGSLKPEGWGSFDPQMILNVCKARFDLDVYKASAEDLARVIQRDPKVLDGARDAIVRASRALREIVGVHGPEVLPYSYQAVLLADALQQDQPLNDALRKNIWEWFWRTTLAEYFQSMTGSLFRRAQTHLRALMAGEVDASPPDLPDTIEPLIKFDFKGARSRAMALLLAELGPQASGDEQFEARTVLAEHGNEALIRLIPSGDLPRAHRRLADGPENRVLLPPREGTALRNALQSRPLRLELAGSHAISESALTALLEGNDQAFLIKRREALWALEEGRAREVGLEYRRLDPGA
jgi:Protein of unknown function DUF262